MNNLLQDLFKNFFNNNNGNYIDKSSPNCNCLKCNASDYPDVFFTSNTNTVITTSNQNEQNNNFFNGLFNGQNIQQILSLLFNKQLGTKSNILSLIENFSPKISNLSSILSKKNTKNDQSQNNETIIDLSEYEVIN